MVHQTGDGGVVVGPDDPSDAGLTAGPGPHLLRAVGELRARQRLGLAQTRDQGPLQARTGTTTLRHALHRQLRVLLDRHEQVAGVQSPPVDQEVGRPWRVCRNKMNSC